MKAKEEEITFNIGDNVRYMLNFKQFEKHTLPKWSVVHKIIDKNVHSYKLDNGKFYKYYELQKVHAVQKLENPAVQPTRQQMAREKTVKRKLTKECISMENIIDHSRLRTKTNNIMLQQISIILFNNSISVYFLEKKYLCNFFQ